MLSLILLLLCLEGETHTDKINFTQTFPLPEDNEMMDPHHFDFSPRGDLYVLERLTPRIHHWNAEGEYVGNFAKEGQGPGELQSPQLLYATADTLWVWDHAGNFSLFNLDGEFIKRVIAPPVRIRRFAVLSDEHILFAFQRREAGEPTIEFHLANYQGESVKMLKSFRNEMFLTQIKGDDNAHVKAFGPEADIFSDKQGTFYFSYSQNRKVFQVDAKGDIVKEFSPNFPTSTATDLEKEAVERMRFVGERGKVYNLKTMPNVKFHYDYDKAYYTHLYIAGDTAAGVLTPISGTDQLKGYNEGFYTVVNFKDDGEAIARGSYRFPEDSQILYNNGRALAVYINDDGFFEVKTFTLQGL